jgi:virulence-associated protein VagC
LRFRTGVKEVSIVREGKRLVIGPSNAVWDDFFDGPCIDLPAQIRDDEIAISKRIYRLESRSKHPRECYAAFPNKR